MPIPIINGLSSVVLRTQPTHGSLLPLHPFGQSIIVLSAVPSIGIEKPVIVGSMRPLLDAIGTMAIKVTAAASMSSNEQIAAIREFSAKIAQIKSSKMASGKASEMDAAIGDMRSDPPVAKTSEIGCVAGGAPKTATSGKIGESGNAGTIAPSGGITGKIKEDP